MIEQDYPGLRRLTYRFVVSHRRKEFILEGPGGEPLMRHVRRTVEGEVRWRKDRDGNPFDSRHRDRHNDRDYRHMPKSVVIAGFARQKLNYQDFLEPVRDLEWHSRLEDEWDARKLISHTSISPGWEPITMGLLASPQIPFPLSR